MDPEGFIRVAGSLCDFLAELNYKIILAKREQKIISYNTTTLGPPIASDIGMATMRMRRIRRRAMRDAITTGTTTVVVGRCSKNDAVVVVAVVVIVIDIVPSGRGQRGQPRTAVKSMPLTIPPEEVGHGRRCHARAIRGMGRIGRRERRGRVVRQGQGGGGVGQEDGDRGGRRQRRQGRVREPPSRAFVLAGVSSAA